jgi:hypothetical protein
VKPTVSSTTAPRQASGIHTLSDVEEQLVKRLTRRDFETDDDIETPAEAA